jgi:urease accessory protein
VFGCLWATGPAIDDESLEQARASLERHGTAAPLSRLAPRLLVARACAGSTPAVRAALAAAWSALRPLVLHRPAVPPRLWAT